MRASELRNFRSPEFLIRAKEELERHGVITNWQKFTPFRDTIIKHLAEIDAELRGIGFVGGRLEGGSTYSPRYAGKVYFVFDSNKLSSDEAEQQAVALTEQRNQSAQPS